MKKQTIGVLILTIAIIFCLIFAVVFYIKFTNINEKYLSVKDTKDCEIHTQTIDALSKEIISLKGGIDTAPTDDNAVKNDAENFLKTFYGNTEKPLSEQITALKELASDVVVSEFLPKPDPTMTEEELKAKESEEPNHTTFKSGIDKTYTYSNKNEDGTMDVLILANLWIIPNGGEVVDSTHLFRGTFTFNPDTNKWILTEVIGNNTIRFIAGVLS